MRTYSISLRIWHWLHAIAVTGLLATFFLRKTFLSWRTNSELIVAKMGEFDIAVTADQAKTIAKAIRAPMWEWHIIFGFALGVLLLWRFAMAWRSGWGYEKSPNSHMKWVYRGYKGVYVLLTFMAFSGIAIYLSADIGLEKALISQIKELHELLAWLVVAFVPLHIAGVAVADNRDQKGLASRMISG